MEENHAIVPVANSALPQENRSEQGTTPSSPILFEAPEVVGVVKSGTRLKLDWPTVLSVAWAMGVAVAFIRLLVGWLRLRRLANVLSPVSDPAIRALWRRVAGSRADTVRLVVSPSGMGLFAFGCQRPHVAVPDDLIATASETEALSLLSHEWAHIQNRDALLGHLQRVASALYWWLPTVHWLNGRLSLSREILADTAAAARVDDPSLYSHSLLNLAAQACRKKQPAMGVIGIAGSRSVLAQRLTTLSKHYEHMKTSLQNPHPFRAALAVLGLCCLCLTVQLTTAQDSKIPPLDPAATADDNATTLQRDFDRDGDLDVAIGADSIADDLHSELARTRDELAETQREVRRLKEQLAKSTAKAARNAAEFDGMLTEKAALRRELELLSNAQADFEAALAAGGLDESASSFSTAAFDQGQQELAGLDELIRRNPNNPDAFAKRGAAHAARGRYDDATRDYRRALELNPDDRQTQANLEALLSAHVKRNRASYYYTKPGEPSDAEPSEHAALWLSRRELRDTISQAVSDAVRTATAEIRKSIPPSVPPAVAPVDPLAPQPPVAPLPPGALGNGR